MGKSMQALLFSLLAAALLAGCQSEQDTSNESSEENNQQEEVTIEVEVSEDEGEEVISTEEHSVEEGTLLLDVMEENYEIEQEEGFINSIEGISAEDGEQKAWMYTVNGEEATVGANEYEVEKGDEINFDFQSWE
ncbi:hypothetical protein GCM10010954_04410 [Halobacillus andaensis]|uniref:Transcobalamin-like C-terminal domain-containing protein n=1 Tax=Halobacillus andaensis TaxID=1176239 RepID=A0A917AY18_HALAA|nr:DUF4430 domain-containing protein [Halobacillus andaensis]MBP2003231.1 putative lipoprotein [Halobacillus andaensis]GGF09086.1 hypothetical protein GCM10010954_04410 [Halobacillus andaensis]